jgi:hypothetical protein
VVSYNAVAKNHPKTLDFLWVVTPLAVVSLAAPVDSMILQRCCEVLLEVIPLLKWIEIDHATGCYCVVGDYCLVGFRFGCSPFVGGSLPYFCCLQLNLWGALLVEVADIGCHLFDILHPNLGSDPTGVVLHRQEFYQPRQEFPTPS